MSYSPQLVYFLDRLSGFSTNIFKLLPSGSPDSGPNSITRITLPANALFVISTTNEIYTQYTSSTPAYTTSRNLGVITFQSRVLTGSFTSIPNTITNYTFTPFILLLLLYIRYKTLCIKKVSKTSGVSV